MPAAWAAGIAGLGGAAMSYKGAGDAQDTMEDQLAFQMKVYNESKKNYQPYLQAGRTALDQYMSQLGLGDKPAYDVSQLPGYQMALQKGLGAVNQGAAGSGMLMSGERMKGLQTEGQSVFGRYYDDYMGRLSGMQGQGFDATQSLANFSSGMASQMGTTRQAIAGYDVDKAGAIGQGFGAGMGMVGSYFGNQGIQAPSTSLPPPGVSKPIGEGRGAFPVSSVTGAGMSQPSFGTGMLGIPGF